MAVVIEKRSLPVPNRNNSLISPFSYHISQTIAGNINTYSEVEQILQPIIFASKIRIYPYSEYDRTVCLRAEIIGCVWDGKSLEFHFSFPICSPHHPHLPEIVLWRRRVTDKGSTLHSMKSLSDVAGNVFIFVLWTCVHEDVHLTLTIRT